MEKKKVKGKREGGITYHALRFTYHALRFTSASSSVAAPATSDPFLGSPQQVVL